VSVIGSYAGWSIETTKNTRAVPTKFVGLLQESLAVEPEFIEDGALYAGRRMPRSVTLGTKAVGGSVRVNLQAETLGTLMRACIGGTIGTTGAGPYTHVITPGALPTATFQVIRRDVGDTARVFEYTGSMVNAWTLSQNAGERGQLQVDLFAYDEDTSQSAATAVYDAAPTPLTFRHVAVNIGGTTVCPDSFTISGTNDISREFKSCANDAGRATIYEASSQRSITMSIPRDFPGLTEHTKLVAGTPVSVSVGWTSGASSVTITGNGYLTGGGTPMVSGPTGLIKETLNVKLFHGSSDASAFTMTIVNDEATA
jgi:hypothetical protein